MTNRYLRLFLSFLCVISFSAYGVTFTLDGITYSTDPIDNEYHFDADNLIFQGVKVESVSPSVTGDLQLPETVEHDGITYVVDAIGYEAFRSSRIKSINMPNVTVIGMRAFIGSGELTKVLLSDKVEVISTAAFAGCNALKSINLPNRLKSFGLSVFAYCGNLSDITIFHKDNYNFDHILTEHNGVYYDEYYNFDTHKHKDAFFVAPSNSKLIVDDDCTAIDRGAFCSWITYAEIPESCELLEMTAAYTIHYLSVDTLKLFKPEPSEELEAFSNSSQMELLVPYGSKEKYVSYIENMNFQISPDNIKEFGLVARFDESQGNVSNIIEDGYTSSIDIRSGSVIKGECKLRIDSKTEYRLGKVTLNDADITGQITDGILSLPENTEGIIDITYEALPSLSISSNSYSNAALYVNGKRVGYNAVTVYDGDFEVEIVPDTKYEINKLTIDGVDCLSELADGKIMIPGNGTRRKLYIELKLKTGVYLEYTGQGEILINNTPVENKHVAQGNNFDILILPADGWEVERVSYANNSYTDSIKNHHIYVSQKSGQRNLIVRFREITEPGEAYLTVSAPDQHTTISSYPEGYSATVSFTPATNWILRSVTYNGEPITIDSDNTVTTPALYGNNELIAIYEQDGFNAITSIEAHDNPALRVMNRTIYIDNKPEDQSVQVYNIDGIMITSTVDDSVMVGGNASTVLVKIGLHTFKVALGR